jgi:hypothetical protein
VKTRQNGSARGLQSWVKVVVMSSKNVDSGSQSDPPANAGGKSGPERREALRQIARFGAYTAPALLVMLASEKAVAGDSL